MSFDSRAVEVAVDEIYEVVKHWEDPEQLLSVFDQGDVEMKVFWILAVSYVASGGNQRQLFVRQMKFLCGWTEMKTASEGLDLLESILWDRSWS